MSSINGDRSAKKRKTVDNADTQVPPGQDGLAHELAGIKSLLGELVDHSRSQMDHNRSQMASMQGKMDAMADQIQHLETRLKYQEAMIRNSTWKYTIQSPPPAYWDGLERNLVRPANSFLELIEKETTKMMRGKGDGHIAIHSIIPYDSAFMDHWRAFANALRQYKYAIKCAPEDQQFKPSLTVGGEFELPNLVHHIFRDGLRMTHFHRVYFESSIFGSQTIPFASWYMRNNNILELLELDECPIESIGMLEEICGAVKKYPTLHTLGLIECSTGEPDGFDILQRVISAGGSKLKRLDLAGNDIIPHGRRFLSDFLARNPPLEELALTDNGLADEDAVLIASSLKHNTNLSYLDLDDNPIESLGWKALNKALFDGTSLDTAVASNHTCTISSSSENQQQLEPKILRSMKIYRVLSKRNKYCLNVRGLEEDNMPLGALPNMLVSIQQHFSRVDSWDPDVGKPLSVVYEIVRRWEKVISVYESLGSTV